MSFITNVESVLKGLASVDTMSKFWSDKQNELAYPKLKARFFYTLSRLDEAVGDETKEKELPFDLQKYMLPKLLVDALNARYAWISGDLSVLSKLNCFDNDSIYDTKVFKDEKDITMLTPGELENFWKNYNKNQNSNMGFVQVVPISVTRYAPHILTDYVRIPCGTAAYEVSQSGTVSECLARFACIELRNDLKSVLNACGILKNEVAIEWAKGAIN